MKLSDLIFEEAIQFNEKEVEKALGALSFEDLFQLSGVLGFLDEKVQEEARRRNS